MECPCCNENVKVSFNRHAEGFAKDVMECSVCGTVWITRDGEADVIKGSVNTAATAA